MEAVVTVRESSHRASCNNNLHQLAIAMQKYESANGCFPPIFMAGYGTTNAVSGWMPQLLPMLEQQDLYEKYHQFDPTKTAVDSFGHNTPYLLNWFDPINDPSTDPLTGGTVPDPQNLPAVMTRVKVFECPSSPGTPADRLATGVGTDPWPAAPYYNAATTDYAGSGGLCGCMVAYCDLPSDFDTLGCGAIALDVGRKLADIPDGLSNTLLINEAAGRPQIWRAGQLVTDKTDEWYNGNAGDLNACGAWAASNYMGYRSFTYDGLTRGGPCAINACNFRGGIYSFHPNGANSALCDGSTRFLSDKIDVNVIVKLITRNSQGVQRGACSSRCCRRRT